MGTPRQIPYCEAVNAETLATVAAELSVMSEGTDRYAERVAELARTSVGGEHDDLLAAVHEAERALKVAHRALQRAQRLAR